MNECASLFQGDIWAESSMMGLLVMYYACMDGAVYQITQWASCQVYRNNYWTKFRDCIFLHYISTNGQVKPDL